VPAAPQRPLDVNGDGVVTPLDALLIINRLNSGAPPAVRPGEERYDINGDGAITPIDVLYIINALNSRAAQGEGEAALPDNSLLGAAGTAMSLEVKGGTAADVFVLEMGDVPRLQVNGKWHSLSAVSELSLDGGGGIDRLTVRAGAGLGTLHLGPGALRFSRGGASSLRRLEALNFEVVSVSAGTGRDIAHLYDSSGNDTYYGSAETALLTNGRFSHEVSGFEEVYLIGGSARDNDRAELTDSSGDN
jgi:hypothetical protein